MTHSPFALSELIKAAELGKDAITAIVLHGKLGFPEPSHGVLELSSPLPTANRVVLGTDKGALLVFDLSNASTSTSELYRAA